MSESKLTEAEQELIHHLPASSEELSDLLDIAPSRVRGRVSEIRQKDINIAYDPSANAYALVDSPKARRVSTKETGRKTREANEFVTEVERTILRRLRGKDRPVAVQEPTLGNEDIVLHLTDLHIGDVVEDQYGHVIYSSRIAEEVVDFVTTKTIQLSQMMTAAAVGIDTLHLLWGGDMITNENIYDGQSFDIERMLADQMSIAVNSLTRQAKTMAEHFDTVNIIAQPGNHGKTRASGVSKQANMDLVVYRWIDDRIREAGIDNINFVTSESTWFRTFPMRGGTWTGFLTHGQDSHKHVDSTAASMGRWRGWLNEFDFDVAYRGHYHESRRESIQNGPMVFESPSPKPPSEWVSQIGYGSVGGIAKRLATVHGVDDSRPVTWEFVIDDSGMELSDEQQKK